MQLRNKLIKALPFALALALAACGGAQKTSSAAADECAAAGTNTARMLSAAAPEAPATMATEIGGAIERHCRADAWTPQAQGCIARANDDKAMDLCDPMLTQAQKDAVGQEIQEIASRAMGGAAYGGAAYGGAAYGGAKYGAP